MPPDEEAPRVRRPKPSVISIADGGGGFGDPDVVVNAKDFGEAGPVVYVGVRDWRYDTWTIRHLDRREALAFADALILHTCQLPRQDENV